MALMQQVAIPAGASGVWKVDCFEVTPQMARFGALRADIGHPRDYVQVGRYTRLTRAGTIVMTDTPAEMRDHYEPVFQAHKLVKGSVLIVGLGLGMVTSAILRSPQITEVTVIEKSADVIALVAPHIQDPRLTIIEADIFEWKPPAGKHYDVAWFDIWDDICADNLPEMATLKRRFARRVGWQGCWAQEECRRNRE